MTAVFVLLFYVCQPPASGVRLECQVRETAAESCLAAHQAVELTLARDRLWFPAACVATTPPPRRAR
jgi:hypothetical protein